MASLVLPELGAMIKNAGWEATAWDEFVHGPVTEEEIVKYDLIALTGLTPSRYRAIDIALMAKRAGVQLVAGGRDVIGWSREEGGMEELHSYYPSICTTICDQDLMSEILADAEREELKLCYQMPRGRRLEFVMPDRSLINPDYYFAGWNLRSSSGCTKNCPWCTVGGNGYHLKDGAILQMEVGSIPRNRPVLDVSDSLCGNSHHLNEVILPIYGRSGLRWGGEAAADDLLGGRRGRSLIEPMAQAGCFLLYIGVESVTRQANAKCDREKAEEVIRRCRRVNIIVIVSLLSDAFGDETEEEILAMIDWAKKWAHFAQFSLIALLPGCAMRRKALQSGRILQPINWEHYDGAHPTMQHVLSPEKRLQLLRKAYADFASPWEIAKKLLTIPVGFIPPVVKSYWRYHVGRPRG